MAVILYATSLFYPQTTPPTGPCRDRWLIEPGCSSGKRLCVIDDSKTPFYFCIDNGGKGFHLKKVCKMNQDEPDGDFRFV